MIVSAIIAAAGKGKRMGTGVNKQYIPLADKPVLYHTLSAISRFPFREIAVAAAPGEEESCREEILRPLGLQESVLVVTGGSERQESVFNALRNLSPNTEIVVIHDGARPFVSLHMLEESVKAAVREGAAVVAVPVKDTIKRINNDGFVVDTPPRDQLWAVQTPQTFQYSIILEAYRRASESGFRGTDDASLVEWLEKPVLIIKGSYDNIKITTPEDIQVAELLLKKVKGEGS